MQYNSLLQSVVMLTFSFASVFFNSVETTINHVGCFMTGTYVYNYSWEFNALTGVSFFLEIRPEYK